MERIKKNKMTLCEIDSDDSSDSEEHILQNDLDDAYDTITENKLQISKIKEWIEEHKLFGSQKCVKCGIREPSRCPFECIRKQEGIIYNIKSCGGFCGHIQKRGLYECTKENMISMHQICYVCTIGKDEETCIKEIYKGVETKKKEKENGKGGFIIYVGTKEYIESL